MMGTRFAALATAFPRHQFPDENRTLSPDTGLTRAHWETVADALLDEVEPYRSAGGGRIDLPGLPSHAGVRSEEHTSELQSLMRISYAVLCLKTKKHKTSNNQSTHTQKP